MKITDKLKFIESKPARNRIIMPPMDTLMANDGFVNAFHIQHYGARSYGGIGTIIVESTAISSEGKIREKDLGIWSDDHIDGLTKLANVIKMGGALAGIQLNHAGAKAELPNEDKIGTTHLFDYLDQKRFSLITNEQLLKIEEKFVRAAHRAKKAGFDFVEIHGAHGYLLCQLMHKTLNEVIKSEDILIRGASVINIVKRIKEEVGIPMGIRLSVVDHVEGGMIIKDYLPMIKELEKYVNYINVSSGETLGRVDYKKIVLSVGDKLFRIPLIVELKKHTNIPLFVSGNISTRKDVKRVLSKGADGVLIGREMLWDPSWVLHNLEYYEMDPKLYSWNDNIWYQHNKYLKYINQIKDAKAFFALLKIIRIIFPKKKNK